MSDENMPNDKENKSAQENASTEENTSTEKSVNTTAEEAVENGLEEAIESAPEEVQDKNAVVENDQAEPAPELTENSPQAETPAEAKEEDTPTPVKKEISEEEEEEEEENTEENDDDNEAVKQIEEKDYHALSKEELLKELGELLKNNAVQDIKNPVEEIKTEFNSKFGEELEQKKQEFLAKGGNIIDFHYTTPLKKDFNSLYFDYKEKRNNYYQNLKKDLQANLNRRLELIEELKGLLNAEENINTTYKHFKDIQESWHTAGAIPRDKYNTIWNTYRHHVENFYDFLHLNREFRDLDFKHNLEQKIKLIGRAEELAQQEDVGKAFRELQMLHKMWKEDVGPVAKEFREEVWEKFSAATAIIHNKRQDYLKDQEKHFETNYETKKELIAKIEDLSNTSNNSHKAWQNAIKEIQKLRDQYFESGKVPRAKTKEIWKSFKDATRNFNHKKNDFYKTQKKEQYTNLQKKRELIEIAQANKDSDDFEVVTGLMKKIQSDWKAIGHVPRKDSDKIWKQFKDACNHYFDRVHAERNEANKEEMEHFEAKQAMLDSMSSVELSGDHKADLNTIKEKIAAWKTIGRVPYNKRNIERKFNKVLDEMFGKLNLGKQETEMIRFENKLNSMASQEDVRKLQNEEFFITKKISETKAEIRQLENNLGFFQHVKEDNPLVKDVYNNIAKHKENLEVWKAKLIKIRALRKEQ